MCQRSGARIELQPSAVGAAFVIMDFKRAGMAEFADDEPLYFGAILDAEGYSAGIVGIEAASNPHRPGTYEHLLWLEGWQDGRASRRPK
jgi:ribosome modulation factor